MIHRFALCQCTPGGRAREARIVSIQTHFSIKPSSKLTYAVISSVQRLLSLPNVGEEQLTRAVEKHTWENIPAEHKGEGKFYRKATPGSWQRDLTPRQIEIIEKVAAPILEEFYA